MLKTKNTVKYTATLPEASIHELKMLAERKVIPSVNFAIREAINLYIVRTKRKIYEEEIQEAARDKDFLTRTMDSDQDFAYVDSEVGRDW